MNVFILSPMITIYLLVLRALTISLIKDVVGESLATGQNGYLIVLICMHFTRFCPCVSAYIFLSNLFWVSKNDIKIFSSIHTCNSGGGNSNNNHIVVDRTQVLSWQKMRNKSCLKDRRKGLCAANEPGKLWVIISFPFNIFIYFAVFFFSF